MPLFVLKPRKMINWGKTKFALTGNFQKVIRALAFRGSEKIGKSFYFKILGTV